MGGRRSRVKMQAPKINRGRPPDREPAPARSEDRGEIYDLQADRALDLDRESGPGARGDLVVRAGRARGRATRAAGGSADRSALVAADDRAEHRSGARGDGSLPDREAALLVDLADGDRGARERARAGDR